MSATGDHIIQLINAAKDTAEIDRILMPIRGRELLQEIVDRANEITNDPVPRRSHRAELN